MAIYPISGALIRSRKILVGGLNKSFRPNSLITSTVNKCQEDGYFIVCLISGNSSTRKFLVFAKKHRILALFFVIVALVVSAEPVAKQLVLNLF